MMLYVLLLTCTTTNAAFSGHETQPQMDQPQMDLSWYRHPNGTRNNAVVDVDPTPVPSGFYNGTNFAGVLTDNTVLQKGPSTKAAIFGIVMGKVSTATTVSVRVTEMNSNGSAPMSYTVAAMVMTMANDKSNLTWKALLNPHAEQGGNISIAASCTNCVNTTEVTLYSLTYGDVWFCSGQSNMELPMTHALTRNRTYDSLDLRGEYSNIRTFKNGAHVARFDGDEVYILAPPPPPSGPKPDMAPTSFFGWQRPNSSVADEFSAACWFFAQELTDMALTANKTAPILGIIQSAWGGTEIDDWIVNKSISKCLNASGAPEPNRQGAHGSVYPDDGALNNGMVAPFLNFTIFGALWYQGENNVHECINMHGGGHSTGVDVGPTACGNVLNNTGYACSAKNLVQTWREQWSVDPSTTSPLFPFGIVSLAAGTSEGNSMNMPNFRLAQTASYGVLPGPSGSGMENTFIAQAYDAGDPGDRMAGGQKSTVDAPYQSNYDMPYPGRVGYSNNGHQLFTQQYMGGLHPRAKQTIGRRLALGAAAIAYNDDSIVYTGPVLKNCSVSGVGMVCRPGAPCSRGHSQILQRQITLNYDETLLGSDAVRVWPTTPDTEGLTIIAMYNCINGTCLASCSTNTSCVQECAILNAPQCRLGLPSTPFGPAANGFEPSQYDANHFHFATGRVVSPLEVQLNGTLWMPASISWDADHSQSNPINSNCHEGKNGEPACVNGSKVDGWSSVYATVPVAIPIGCQHSCPPADELHGRWCVNCTDYFSVTGVRYAWAESPCCGGNLDTSIIPCPVNACPISTYNSTLPAVPFSAKIKYTNFTDEGVGSCSCVPPQQC
eukprot:m.135537 g.135537  ORF g.135537 m.135537 type:complete len:835 (+) comp29800_c0_seq1:114-2618(+)